MRKFLVERVIPGAGLLDERSIQDITARAFAALRQLRAPLFWDYTIRTSDRLICVMRTCEMTVIHEHAHLAGFPVTRIIEIVDEIHSGLDFPCDQPQGLH